jgi:hypothetical protein
MDERTPLLRRALVDAIAAAHRLQQRAVAERREAERWRQRASYADQRGMSDLAGEARARVDRHTSMAQLLEQRAAEMRTEVESLRAELETPAMGGRPPPVLPVTTTDRLNVRLAELEVERELDKLKAARTGGGPAGTTSEPDPDAINE